MNSIVSESRSDEPSLPTRYRRAERLLQAVYSGQKMARNTQLAANWIGDSDCFWYCRETRAGCEYRIVDARALSNLPAFDHDRLAIALQQASRQTVNASTLALSALEFDLRQQVVSFDALGGRWKFESNKSLCTRFVSPRRDWVLSPDRLLAAFVRDENLWIYDCRTGKERQLTLDGCPDRVYASAYACFGPRFAVVDLLWSPDSQTLLTQRIDSRNTEPAPPLVEHVPLDGSLRPHLRHPERKISLPVDPVPSAYELLTIHVNTGAIRVLEHPPCPVLYPFYRGYFGSGRAWWTRDSRHACFIDQAVDKTQVKLMMFDGETGRTRTLIEEAPNEPIELVPVTHVCTLVCPLPETGEVIWFSDRSGWGHLYLYDQYSGELKHSLTQGEWQVRTILHVDVVSREILIQTAGRVAHRNPYYSDICRVHLDTGELTPLVSTDHDYAADDGLQMNCLGREFDRAVSPSGGYIVATRSRVNTVPESVLLDRNGREQMLVEVADITDLPTSWSWPEPVTTRAADGTTSICGVVFRPSDYSPAHRYPVLDLSWSYPEPVRAFHEGPGGESYLSAAAWAELGFIVVKFENRGGDFRGRNFREAIDPQLPLHNKADCVAGIQQLAANDPSMDLDRVGVVDQHGTPAALTGLLVYPDIYRVGICISPQDPRFLPAAYGVKSGFPLHEDFAHRLQGKLLLVHGMLDSITPIHGSLRMVAALERAHKSFDQLMLPDMGYLLSDYAQQRCWDYLVEHLLGEVPPQNFKLSAGLSAFAKAFL